MLLACCFLLFLSERVKDFRLKKKKLEYETFMSLSVSANKANGPFLL